MAHAASYHPTLPPACHGYFVYLVNCLLQVAPDWRHLVRALALGLSGASGTWKPSFLPGPVLAGVTFLTRPEPGARFLFRPGPWAGRGWVLAQPRACAGRSFGPAGVRFLFTPEGSIGLFSPGTHPGVIREAGGCARVTSTYILPWYPQMGCDAIGRSIDTTQYAQLLSRCRLD